MKLTPHYITAINPSTNRTVEFEYDARNTSHARQLFNAQYPAWEIKSVSAPIRWIYTALVVGVVLTIGGLGVASQFMPEADARTNTVENHAND
jgi:hypothetical protein